jgi:flagellar protein FlgJ
MFMEIKAKSNQRGRPVDPAAVEKKLQDVASLYEKQFLREMVKQMRTTVSESEWMPSGFAEKYYREQLDQQYVESWGDRGGIGLSKVIYDQLMERYGERLGIRLPKQKAAGPLPLGVRDQWTGDIQEKNKAIRFDRTKNDTGKPLKLEAPWDGQWLGSFQLDNGQQVAKISHDGIQSTFVGHFQFGDKEIGAVVKAGEVFGTLTPDAKSFLWKLE